MAVVSFYNHTRARFLDGTFKVGDTYKANLYSALPFTPGATTKAAAEAGATQLPTANGYTQDSKALANVTVTIVNTNEARLDADDPVWTASGSALVASYALLFNDTHADDAPVIHIDLGGGLSANPGFDLRLQWDPDGIITSKSPA
jgi:hypothetical protein